MPSFVQEYCTVVTPLVALKLGSAVKSQISGVELTTATGRIVAVLSDDFFEVTVNEDDPETTLVSEIAGKSMYWEAPIATVLSTLGAGPHVASPAWLATRRHCPEMIG
jgi:hypothetical protein